MLETGPNGIKFISGGSGLIDILNVEKNSMFQLINSINPIEMYLIIGRSDLLPKDKNNPTGKQNIKQKMKL